MPSVYYDETAEETADRELHIVPRAKRNWAVVEPHFGTLGAGPSQSRWVNYAKDLLAHTGGVIVVHGRDGMIRRSYRVEPTS